MKVDRKCEICGMVTDLSNEEKCVECMETHVLPTPPAVAAAVKIFKIVRSRHNLYSFVFLQMKDGSTYHVEKTDMTMGLMGGARIRINLEKTKILSKNGNANIYCENRNVSFMPVFKPCNNPDCTIQVANGAPYCLGCSDHNTETFAPLEPITGDRKNQGKPAMSIALEARHAMEGLTRVLEMGAEKYSRGNWRKGLNHSEVADSLIRHLSAYLSGETLDDESGLPHVDHVLCNALFLSELTRTRPDLNNIKNN